ncbi:MAG: glycine betaine ABC transporter substrate-binding protein [Gemmatimonadota bacterium]
MSRIVVSESASLDGVTQATRRARGGVSRVLAAVLLAFVVACAEPAPAQRAILGDDAITIGSFDFPESVLLAELYGQAIGSRGIPVHRELAIGPRELVMPALQRGLIELIPEYSGSALAFLGGSVSRDPGVTLDRLRAELSLRGLRPLAPAPAQNQNGFAVTASTAEELGLRTLSDLVPHAPTLRFGGPPECALRPLCLEGLEDTYGLRFDDVVTLDAGGPLTLQALHNEFVDVALLFSSDGALDDPRLVLLEDDRGLQPPERIVPVLHARALDRFGALVSPALDAVSGRLTTEELRTMNAAVASGREPAEIARAWLRRQGLIGTD